MERIDQAVPLAPALEQIAARRQAYRTERIARYGWSDTVSCPACGDTGEPPDTYLTVCGCPAGERLLRTRRRRVWWEDEIPRAMRGWSLAAAPDRIAAAEVRRWLECYLAGTAPDELAPNLILRGDVGAGKTGLAIGVLAELCQRDVGFGFQVVAEFLDRLRPGASDVAQADTMRRAQGVAVLVLDDLGAEKPGSDWVLERLYVVLNHRMNAGTPTIITTNLPHRLLRELAGERLLRRITQDGRAWEVVVRRVRTDGAQP